MIYYMLRQKNVYPTGEIMFNLYGKPWKAQVPKHLDSMAEWDAERNVCLNNVGTCGKIRKINLDMINGGIKR